MMLDEEALANEQSRVPPGAPPPTGPVPQEGMDPEIAAESSASRPATPQEEKMFATVVKMALKSLTSPKAADYLFQAAQSQGPEKALAAAVNDVVQGVLQAAQAGGQKLPPPVQMAAAQIVAQALAKLMADGGLVDDPQALAEAALAQMGGGDDVAPE